MVRAIEGLYCKRPFQCLASSEILTPQPLTARRVCIPAFGAGVERGWGSIVRKTPDTAMYSIYLYIFKYFVVLAFYLVCTVQRTYTVAISNGNLWSDAT
jgi:hypothetical protein